jgi:hypothetical protein
MIAEHRLLESLLSQATSMIKKLDKTIIVPAITPCFSAVIQIGSPAFHQKSSESSLAE